MCRLFAMKANKRVDLTLSLSDRSGDQTPDGWGLGWYTKEGPALEKALLPAPGTNPPALVTGMDTRVAVTHVRQASHGAARVENCHPFTYKQWMFAHIGTLNHPQLLKEKLVEKRRACIKGDTDSEVFFHYIVQCIREHELDAVAGIRTALRRTEIDGGTRNLVLTNLNNLFAYRDLSHTALYYLERPENLPFAMHGRELPTLHESRGLSDERSVVVASEPLTDEAWKEIPEGYLLVVPNGLECQLIKM